MYKEPLIGLVIILDCNILRPPVGTYLNMARIGAWFFPATTSKRENPAQSGASG